jgi:hypothetical protein
MARTIIGQLVLRLQDQLSGKAKNAAKSLRDVESAAAGIGKAGDARNLDRLAGAIDRVSRHAKEMSGMHRGVETWGQSFQRSIERLRATGSELDYLRRSWRHLNHEMNRSGHIGRSPAFRAAAIQTWQNNMVAALTHVKAQLHEVDQIESRLARTGRRLWGVAGAVAGVGSGVYVGQRVARTAGTEGASLERERTRFAMQGRTPDEIAAAEKRAEALAEKYGFVTAEIMGTIRDTVGVFGSYAKAEQMAEPLTQLLAILRTSRGEAAGRDATYVSKALEVLKKTQSEEEFTKGLNAFAKASAVLGEQLRADDWLGFAKYVRSAGVALDDEFLYKFAPILASDLSGSGFGTMIATTMQALVGGRQKKESFEMMDRFGIKGEGNQAIAYDELLANPVRWTEKYLIPALAKQGISAEAMGQERFEIEAVAALSEMFSNRLTAEAFTKIVTGLETMKAIAAQIDRATGLEQAESLKDRDPFAAFDAAGNRLQDLLAALANPLMPAANAALGGFSDLVDRLTKHIRENGIDGKTMLAGGAIAAGTGLAAWKALGWLTGGAALKGSAAALMGSAAALDAAAMKLATAGAGGTAGAAAGAAGAAAGAGGSGLRWRALLGGVLGAYVVSGIPDDKEELAEFMRRNAERSERWNVQLRQWLPDFLFPERPLIDRLLGGSGVDAGRGARAKPGTATDQAIAAVRAAIDNRTGETTPRVRPYGAGSVPPIPTARPADLSDALQGLSAATQEAFAGAKQTAERGGTDAGVGFASSTAAAVAANRGKVEAEAESLWQRVAAILSRQMTMNLQLSGQERIAKGWGGPSPAAGARAAAGDTVPAARASGGSVYPGVSYIVGEHGEERFTPDVAGQIDPIRPDVGAGRGAIGDRPPMIFNATFNVAGITDPEIFVQHVSRALEQRFRQDADGLFADYGMDTA